MENQPAPTLKTAMILLTGVVVLGLLVVPGSTPIKTLTISDKAVSAVAAVVCSNGYYAMSGKCLPCPSGHMCTGGKKTKCPVGTYQPYTYRTTCFNARCGYFVPEIGSTMQLACRAGTYQPKTRSSKCVEAPVGSYVPRAGSCAVYKCRAGSYQDCKGQASCMRPTCGHYVPKTGATVATKCPAGTYQRGQGYSYCNAAPRGYFSTTGACMYKACLAGTYQPRTRQARCVAASCGHYVAGPRWARQIACPRGQYQPAKGQAGCVKVPSGYVATTDKCGLTKLAACGEYLGKNGKVTKCRPGMYQSNTRQTKCLQCPTGSYAPKSGACKCRTCPAGQAQFLTGMTYCFKPPCGFYAPRAGSVRISRCPAGTYQNLVGQSSCKRAQPGEYAPGGGCKPLKCPIGTYSAKAGQAKCAPAACGEYVNKIGQTSARKCAAGSYQPKIGQSKCLASSKVKTAGSCSAIPVHPVCIPAGPRNRNLDVFGTLKVPMSGTLRGITLTYKSGRLEFLSGNRVGGRWGFVYGWERGYQVYLTNANRRVLFPVASTPGVRFQMINRCYYFVSGPLAKLNKDIVNGKNLYMQFAPVAVRAGQVLRLYTGQNLFRLRWAWDDHGATCATARFDYVTTSSNKPEPPVKKSGWGTWKMVFQCHRNVMTQVTPMTLLRSQLPKAAKIQIRFAIPGQESNAAYTVTSKVAPTGYPNVVSNFKKLKNLNSLVDGARRRHWNNFHRDNWSGSATALNRFWFSCVGRDMNVINSGSQYRVAYHACNNGYGVHVVRTLCNWKSFYRANAPDPDLALFYRIWT